MRSKKKVAFSEACRGRGPKLPIVASGFGTQPFFVFYEVFRWSILGGDLLTIASFWGGNWLIASSPGTQPFCSQGWGMYAG